MKILHAYDLFCPAGGGIATVMRDVVQALSSRGHQITIYSSDYKYDNDFTNPLPPEIEIRLFHTVFNLSNFNYMPSITREAKQRLSEFDVIHLHTYRSYQNLVLHKFAVDTNVPYVIDSHGTLPRRIADEKSMTWLLKNLFDATTRMKILKDASKVISHSTAANEEYIRFGVSRENIVLIQPPLNMLEFKNLPPAGVFRKSFRINKPKVILSLGRIHRIKGLEFLVESFRQVADVRDDVILVFAGEDDGYLKKLEQKIEDLHLGDRIIFTGFLQGKAKQAALVDADVVVQPSIYEYNSRVMYEALLCGVPFVTSSGTMSSENLQTINGGYLIKYGNHQDLKETLIHVLNHPDEARSKAQKAGNYIQTHLTVSEVVKKYEALYHEVINSG